MAARRRQTCRVPLRRARVLGQSGAVRRGQAESFKGATRRPLCCQTMEPFFCPACTPSRSRNFAAAALFYSTQKAAIVGRLSTPSSARVHTARPSQRVSKLEGEAASRSPHASQGHRARVHKGESRFTTAAIRAGISAEARERCVRTAICTGSGSPHARRRGDTHSTSARQNVSDRFLCYLTHTHTRSRAPLTRRCRKKGKEIGPLATRSMTFQKTFAQG